MDGDIFEYDDIGKIDLTDVYNQPTPRDYFTRLSQLDYRVAQEAKPAFQSLIEARRTMKPDDSIKVVDIGCSYGVNAALLKFDLSIQELNAHYAGAPEVDRSSLLARDARLFSDPTDADLSVIGLDTADRAIDYAVEAGILDGGITSNLEEADLGHHEDELLSDIDLIVSTGCFGYVTDKSLTRILDASEKSRPWMAHMVLRMFDFSEAEEILARRGYVTERIKGTVPQRRFASADEKRNALENLALNGIDPAGLEVRGWYFAELFVSLPEEVAETIDIHRLVPPLQPAQQLAGVDPVAAKVLNAAALRGQ